MPRLIGFSQSTFNADNYQRATCNNHGSTLTTEGILHGIDMIVKDIEMHPDNDWLEAMKETPAYISSVENK